MLLLHGSATGTATDVATSLFRLARRYRVPNLELSALEDLDLVRLLDADIAVFVVSTTGNGDIPGSMHGFWSTLLRSDLDHTLLEDLNFVILGLGDSKYTQFNWTAKKLRRRLISLGSHEAMDIVLCDESAHEGIDTNLTPFFSLFQNFLQQLVGGQSPIPNEIVLPPVCPLLLSESTTPDLEPLALNDRLSHRFGASLNSNTRMTTKTHFQDVRLLQFIVTTGNGTSINPGDVLSLYPASSDESVNRALVLLGWNERANCLVRVPKDSKASKLFCTGTTTLHEFVKHAIPLHGVPSLSLFSRLKQFTSDENFIEKFDEWETADGKDDLYDYLTRPRRTLLEVLEDFSSGIQVPVEHCIDLFGLTVSRSYSIAGARTLSSMELSRSGDSKYEVELLVAMVMYQTKIKEPRQGLASRFLSNLKPSSDQDEEQLLITIEKPIIQENKMPEPPVEVPLLLICTGTGFAPLRFFIERLQQRHGKVKRVHDITLLFGCRSFDDDLVVQTLDKSCLATISVRHAYSRLPDQPRTYVQDLIRTHADAIRNIVDCNGQVYLCGSSGAMPDAVSEAMDSITLPGMTDTLRETGRWWQETW